MDSVVCPTCNSQTPAEYNFCVMCNKQVKCLNPECGKLLVSGKPFCFVCGRSLAAVPQTYEQPNKYSRTVKQQGENYEESTEFTVSDHAVTELAPFIAGEFNSRLSGGEQNSRERPYKAYSNPIIPSAAQDYNHTAPQLSAAEDRQGAGKQTFQAEHQIQVAQQTSKTSRYFIVDEGELVPTTKDFKGENWADQQRNFIVMFGLAYHENFNRPMPRKEAREAIRSSANKINIADNNNFSRYMERILSDYFTPLSSGFQMNDDGRIEAERVLDVISKATKSGFEYWGRSRTETKRVRLGKDEKNMVKEWASEHIELGKIDITGIKKPRDYALISIWILTIYLHKSQAVNWNTAYLYMIEKFDTVTVSAEAFSAAVRSEANESYFSKTVDGNYFLSPEGKKLVESWMNGSVNAEANGSLFV